MSRPLRSALSLVSTGLLAFTLAACSGSNSSTNPTTGGSVAGATSASSGDISFALDMIAHHKQVIVVADMALKKSTSTPAMREYATSTKQIMTAEIATLTGWLRSWGASPSSTSSLGYETGMLSAKELARLNALTGQDFNTTWQAEMTGLTMGAVNLTNQVGSTTKNSDVMALAQTIFNRAAPDIAKLRKMEPSPSPAA